MPCFLPLVDNIPDKLGGSEALLACTVLTIELQYFRPFVEHENISLCSLDTFSVSFNLKMLVNGPSRAFAISKSGVPDA